MKSFKEYRDSKESKEKLPAMETSFGSHSVPKNKEKLQALETSFGSHSVPKKEQKLGEGVDPTEAQMSDPEYHRTIHTKHAPFNDDILHNHHGQTAVKSYTDDSSALNNALHVHYKYGNVPTNTHKRTESLYVAKHLSALLNTQRTKEDMTVFTGIPHSPSKYFKDPSRKVKVHLPAFTSTSTDHMTASFFASNASDPADEDHGIDGENKHILKIHLPKGSKAVSMREHSFAPDENEILMHRGHNIILHPNPEKTGPNQYTWTATVHSHTPEEINEGK